MDAVLQVSVHVEQWSLTQPFRITGRTREVCQVILLEMSDGAFVGRGEGAPVHYLGETPEILCKQVEEVIPRLVHGVDHAALLDLMPAGAARNAIDCALWDLEAKRSGRSVWELTGIDPKALRTVFTIGIEDTPEEMAAQAAKAAFYSTLKIKLNADRPVERVAAVRAVRPDARLTVDANQAWTFEQLAEIAPALVRLDVKLIEQPLPRGADEKLDGYVSPIPLCADESCQHRGELQQAVRRYQIINIKIDKAGGLHEGLLLARAVREAGLELLVSCMVGTSLNMAPAFVLAQLADYVELDGPLLLRHDRPFGFVGENGKLSIPDARLWGANSLSHA